MNIIKRDGEEVIFDKSKIFNAITKANNSVDAEYQLSIDKIKQIVRKINTYAEEVGRALTVEEVQDKVEEELVRAKSYAIAKSYITYRYNKDLQRKSNGLDMKILSLVENNNEEVKQENANKNPAIAATQRDYIAGLLSREITNKLLLPEDVVKAHEEGIIHFHDSDYFISHIFNCCLVNLEDMLQNGTVISKTKIEKPHSFQTACNVASQIAAQIASNQYGGQTISLAHLAPFVDVSRQNIKKRTRKNLQESGIEFTEESLDKMVEATLKEEIRSGVQLIQYQVNTLSSVNGQSPFLSVCMYLNEAKNEREKEDLAMVIEEVLKQRIQGVKNEFGVWVAPAFPKLLYVLQEDNIHEGDKYWYLTELAAQCTAKRMVPDYISEKVMKENKIDKAGNGNCYPCINKICA